MNHRHRKVLHALFSHPVPNNIYLREIEATLKELGATIDFSGHGRAHIELKGHSTYVHGSDHALNKDEVGEVKKLIESAGIDPERDYPL